MKTQVEDINRNIYDIKNKDDYDFKIKKGLTPEKLLVLQDHVLNYNVEVSLVGTLARKIVAAVETLTRS